MVRVGMGGSGSLRTLSSSGATNWIEGFGICAAAVSTPVINTIKANNPTIAKILLVMTFLLYE
jgi:hypothetical protein